MSLVRYILLVIVIQSMEAARILGVFPFAARSHYTISASLLQELANRGHSVTVISPYPEVVSHANLTNIVIEEISYRDHKLPDDLFTIRGAFTYTLTHWEMGISLTNAILERPVIKKFISRRDHYDAVLMEVFFNEALYGFAHKFKAPLIQISTVEGASWISDWFGNIEPYSHVPNNYLPYGESMSLWQRCMNTAVGIFYRLGRYSYYLPQQEELLKKHFSSVGDLPSVTELERNTSLILLNHHYILSTPKPLLPNMIQIGGMHIKKPKPLPQDLQKYMDESPQGVIYFSMGTHLRSSQFPKDKKQALFNAFSKLKQRVLWKWEANRTEGQPNNVKLNEYLPQFSILNHPNLRIFITHCGVSSTQEAAYAGVPIIGIPVFGDQGHNCAKSVTAGYGVVLDFEQITTESFYSAIKEVLQPRYLENARRLSQIYRDQPQPLEKAVFWTEYVIRHKGAPYMRSAALDLTWYEYFLLDVITIYILAFGAIMFISFFLLNIIARNICNNDMMSLKKKLN